MNIYNDSINGLFPIDNIKKNMKYLYSVINSYR